MRNRNLRLVGLVAILGLQLVSCGGSDVEIKPQTLEEFIGWDEFDERAAHEAWLENDSQIQELTAECMHNKGLEYTPFGPFLEPQSEQWLDSLEMSDSEFKLRHGYGFFAAMLEEYEFNTEHADELAQENPNEAIHGRDAPEGVDYMAEWRACAESAEIEVRGEPDTELIPALDRAWSPLESAMQQLLEDYEQDPRLIEAQEEWANCMRGKGYDFTSEADIENYFWPMLDEIEAKGGIEALMEGVIPAAEIQALAEAELAVAADDVACRADLDELSEELRAEYGAKFIAEHLEQLEKIRELEQKLMAMRLDGKEPE